MFMHFSEISTSPRDIADLCSFVLAAFDRLKEKGVCEILFEYYLKYFYLFTIVSVLVLNY